MAAFLKSAVEAGLAHGGPAAVARLFGRPRFVVLTYHNILPEGAEPVGDTSLHLPVRKFETHLDAIAAIGDVVPLDAALEPDVGAGRRVQFAITFDDAYAGAVTVGVDALARRGWSATIFVAPAFIGGREFWWDSLTPPGAVGPSPSLRQHALERLDGDDVRVRHFAAQAGYPSSPLPSYARAATDDQLERAAAAPGIRLASHTWNHRNLTTLSDPELSVELSRPLEWLRERFATAAPWISYPYGLTSARVEAAAAQSGYAAAFGLAAGRTPARPSGAFDYPRCNVPSGMSSNGLVLRLSGMYSW